jgi:DNA modification methylase
MIEDFDITGFVSFPSKDRREVKISDTSQTLIYLISIDMENKNSRVNLVPEGIFIGDDITFQSPKIIGEDFSLAMCEMLWSSFDDLAKIFRHYNQKGNKIHPTQKPVALYKWLLRNYAKEGDKIFDSHMGSQSSRIACWDGGFDFLGCELDPEYYRDGCKRFENHIKQLKLF